MQSKPLGQILKDMGYITQEHIEIALAIQKLHKNKRIGEILEELAFVSPKEVAEALSKQFGRPYINLLDIQPSEEALKVLNQDLAKRLEVMPIRITGKILFVALLDPSDETKLEKLRKLTGYEIEYYITDKESFYKALKTHYLILNNPIEKFIRNFINDASNKIDVSTRVPKFFENIINMAILERATDIHISPEKLGAHIFFRIDGLMQYYYSYPLEIHNALVSRIKIISNMDIAEKRNAQDGSFTHKFFDEEYDLRVSTVPTAYGENVVIRVLSKNASIFKLQKLGFEPDVLEKFKNLINKPRGIILITGPTGSGKTTTLYASLREIDILKKNVLTVEDPIEYKFPFIKQTQVNERAGYTFAQAIRSFLRQDPDVILVGEIRDEETAQMAIRASITGHLVLSTLHTNNAVGAIPRLVDMNIKSYMIASGLIAVSGQRLIRKVCQFCKETEEYTVEEFANKFGYDLETVEKLAQPYLDNGKLLINFGKGCEHCRFTGFQGRMTIVELLEIDDEIEDLIAKNVTPLQILMKAKEKGMKTLKEDGLIKVFRGITSVNEIKRVVG
ncbi:MAG: type II secretion system protein E [Persephonella sp.]|nr:MAG: type II secretion system protein E [Persephonella sp.]RUM59970.1 MAG: type II secretion system protein E [Persephonella sp.]